MDISFLLLVLSFPVLLQVCLAIFTYVDAPDQGMDRTKWTLVALLIPVFGFFAYLLERAERNSDPPAEDQFVDGPFRIHKSRADDTPVVSGGPSKADDPEDSNRDE